MSNLEWQVAEGSNTAHVMDLDGPDPKRSGRKSLCGRRPQRNYREWFSLPVDEPDVARVLSGYFINRCPDCLALLLDGGAS